MNHPIDVDLLIFDVDGTLRECTVAGQPCPNKPGEWRLKPNVQAVLQNYALRYWQLQEPRGTVQLALVSNQAGVALGFFSATMAGLLLLDTLREALQLSRYCPLLTPGLGLSVRWCATHPKQPDMRRKPNPGMLWEAMLEHGVLPDRTLMVGDRPEDAVAAEQANVPFMWADTFFGQDAMAGAELATTLSREECDNDYHVNVNVTTFNPLTDSKG